MCFESSFSDISKAKVPKSVRQINVLKYWHAKNNRSGFLPRSIKLKIFQYPGPGNLYFNKNHQHLEKIMLILLVLFYSEYYKQNYHRSGGLTTNISHGSEG